MRQITRTSILKSSERSQRVFPVITGPTASGKSQIALQLASAWGCDILSCDSRQVYRGMNIGTAKPSVEEQRDIKHWLIDLIEPDETYSLFRYFDDAERVMTDLVASGRSGIICGGTGLYLRTLIDGVGIQEESDPVVRGALTKRAAEEGTVIMHQELQQVDPVSASKIHTNDAQRIIRALAVYHQTGKPLSLLQKTVEKKSAFTFRVVKLVPEREKLYVRINSRVDEMVNAGLYDEFRELVKKGYHEKSPGMQCVGYREFFEYEKGCLSFKDAVELIKQNTRRFAKRQITWFTHQQAGLALSTDEPLPTLVEKINIFFNETAFE